MAGKGKTRRVQRAYATAGVKMNGREQLQIWASERDRVIVAHGPRQSELGGRLTHGIKLLDEDDAANEKRFKRSEAFIHQPREVFPED